MEPCVVTKMNIFYLSSQEGKANYMQARWNVSLLQVQQKVHISNSVVSTVHFIPLLG